MSSQKIVALAALVSCLSFSNPAGAQETRPDFGAETLSGNWGGFRDRLYDAGMTVDVAYKLGLWPEFVWRH